MTITITSSNSADGNTIRQHFERLQGENTALKVRVTDLFEQNKRLEMERDVHLSKVKNFEEIQE